MTKQVQKARLFEMQFLRNCARNTLLCPKCKNEYSGSYTRNANGTPTIQHRPFILPCGHNLCEFCIIQNYKRLKCFICDQAVNDRPVLAHQHGNYARLNFHLNYFMYGELNTLRFFLSLNPNANSNSDGGGQFMATGLLIEQEKAMKPLCEECDVQPAVGTCRTCTFNYCQKCYENVHSNSKILKMHTLLYFNAKHPENLLFVQPHKCVIHKARYCKYFCEQCRKVCCNLCAQADHLNHNVLTVVEWNNRHKNELEKMLNSVKVARDNLKKSQTSVKYCEKQWFDYATVTYNDIHNYFVELHTMLQHEEQKIYQQMKVACQQPQSILDNANNALNKTESILYKMRKNLENYQVSLPTYFTIQDITTHYNEVLDKVHLEVKCDHLQSNPFSFKKKRNLLHELKEYYEIGYEQPEFNIDIQTLCETSAYEQTMSMDMEISLPSELSIFSKPRLQQPLQIGNIKQILNDERMEMPHMNALVRICHIISPTDFYIQEMTDVKTLYEISEKYTNFSMTYPRPLDIHLDCVYMVYYEHDRRWYRGKVLKRISNENYELNLVDFGLDLQVQNKFIIDILPEDLELPYAAKNCGIHGIRPLADDWSEDATNLLREITKNDSLRLHTIKKTHANRWEIDLFTTDQLHSVSLHECFIYTGMAGLIANSGKRSSLVAQASQRIAKESLHTDETHTVKVLHIEDPLEFYVIKLNNVKEKGQMLKKLNAEFDNNKKIARRVIYAAPVKMSCAVKLNNQWQRASIEEIMENGNICIRLVDEGVQEIVNWRQLYVLPTEYRQINEFALKCTLADIETLQKHNYAWTEDAKIEFKQLCAYPHLQIDVRSCVNYEHQVILYQIKSNVSINVGGLLVQLHHGLSTGPATTMKDVKQQPEHSIIMSESRLLQTEVKRQLLTHPAETELQGMKKIKRSAVHVVHIVSPSEFYVHLHNMSAGIKVFQELIQTELSASAATEMNLLTRDIKEHCFVYTQFQTSDKKSKASVVSVSSPAWYRGIIKAVSSDMIYTVYLRDFGATVEHIRADQLRYIAPKWDKVANAATRCHLACLKPTGGLSHWSNSALDYFKQSVFSYEAVSVTMQAQRDANTQSIPVIVWGTINKTANPLAPNIKQYANINRMLVMHGLAHLTERLDFTNEMINLVKLELQESEISLENWLLTIDENSAVDNMVASIPKNPVATEEIFCTNNFGPYKTHIDVINDMDDEPTEPRKPVPKAWLTAMPINNTQFTGYPTHVDDNFIIYIQEYNSREFVKTLCTLLAEKYGAEMLNSVNRTTEYAEDQPCIVQYHLDKKLYRGIVRNREYANGADELYNVFFIDFGNIEQCLASELLPYAPFKQLPALCSQFTLANVKPLKGTVKYSTAVLDIIHKIIVDKMLSVTIDASQLQLKVKKCRIRLNGVDLAEDLAQRGYVEYGKADAPFKQRTHRKQKQKKLIFPQNKINTTAMEMAILNYEEYADASNSNPTCGQLLLDTDTDMTSISQNIDTPSTTSVGIGHPKVIGNETAASSSRSTQQPNSFKQHLFRPDEYMSIPLPDEHNEAIIAEPMVDVDMTEHNGSIYGDLFMDEVNYADADIIELEHTFSMNWYKDEEGAHNEGHIKEVQSDLETATTNKQKATLTADHLAIEQSSFYAFKPIDSSTHKSDFSSLVAVKPNYLPLSVFHFLCHVEAVMSPTIIYIFPHLMEFEYRFQSLQRAIECEIKQNKAELLQEFKVGDLCLARYTKDKQWYRATIRSHNVQQQEVVVFYLDYLNVETLPVTQLRKCSDYIISNWPSRTIKVRLVDLQPNPNMHAPRVQLALQKMLQNRVLYAHVKHHALHRSLDALSVDSANEAHFPTFSDGNDDDDEQSDDKLLGIALYKDEDSQIPVYERLIDQGYYLRN